MPGYVAAYVYRRVYRHVHGHARIDRYFQNSSFGERLVGSTVGVSVGVTLEIHSFMCIVLCVLTLRSGVEVQSQTKAPSSGNRYGQGHGYQTWASDMGIRRVHRPVYKLMAK